MIKSLRAVAALAAATVPALAAAADDTFESLSSVAGALANLAINTASAFTPPVPEPETWALMAAGLAFVGYIARRGRR